LIELLEDEFSDLFTMMHRVDELLKTRYDADAYNLGLNDEPAAGQTVPHLHFHVVPRQTGDVENPRGGIRNFLPNPLTDYPSDTNRD
jgi:diadenosine tetraphosphate (Ap4A) HIT family hydrolase